MFSNTAPNVTVFAKSWRPQRSVRANTTVDRQHSRRALLGERRRHVFAQPEPAAIGRPELRARCSDSRSPTRGVQFRAAKRASIRSPAASPRAMRACRRISHACPRSAPICNRVRRSSACGLSPIPRTTSAYLERGVHVLVHHASRCSGFSSTAANPLDVVWARSAQGPHQFNYNMRYNLFDAVRINWNGMFRSGSAFTPVVAGDINGDGYFNDRAFIYSATAADPALADGCASCSRTLRPRRANVSRSRWAISRRATAVTGPWSSNASLSLTLDRAKFRMPQRANVQFSREQSDRRGRSRRQRLRTSQGMGTVRLARSVAALRARLRSDDGPLQVRGQPALRRHAAGSRHPAPAGRPHDVDEARLRRDARASDARPTARHWSHATGIAISRAALPQRRREQCQQPDGASSFASRIRCISRRYRRTASRR